MNTVEKVMTLHPIVTGIGTAPGRTEIGEDNTLDLRIGPTGWWNVQSMLNIFLSDIDDVFWECLLSRLIH